MIEALATLLATRVKAALPFIDRGVGVARLSTKPIPDGEGTRIVKTPVPVAFTAADCELDERYLVPDEKTKGILFFEDGGVQALVNAQNPANLNFWQASLRLVLWVNTPLLPVPITETALILLIERALKANSLARWSNGDYLNISITSTVLPAETNLYSRYTFDTETPLLLPPYRVLGLDLRVQFRLGRCVLPPAVIVAPMQPGLPYTLPFVLTA